MGGRIFSGLGGNLLNSSSTPTLEDVARVSGVSTATISRCLNEPDKVAESTRNKINQVIEELGYTPNSGGRALASNKSRTVGAVIPTMANAMFASGLQAFEEELSRAGFTLLVATSGYDPKKELDQIRSLVSHGADGLLLIGGTRSPATEKFLNIRNIPFVSSWSYIPKSDSLFVGFDNNRSAYCMTEKVMEYGHKRIAIITSHTEFNDRSGNRVKGIREAVANNDGTAEIVTMKETHSTLQLGGEAFEAIMKLTPAATAIICTNDVLASGAIIRARELEIDIPGKVSITGFDDIDLAQTVSPSLTTVRVPQVDMGRKSALTLLELLSNPHAQLQSHELETKIILRQSLRHHRASQN